MKFKTNEAIKIPNFFQKSICKFILSRFPNEIHESSKNERNKNPYDL